MADSDSWLRQNSFTFVRLALASMVVIGHACALGGFGADPIANWSHRQTSMGSVAVLGFFALSGFLLTHSLTASPALDRFFIHRFFRIMPGFWISLAVVVFVLAPSVLMTQAEGSPGYIESLRVGPDSALEYLLHNCWLAVRQFNIASLFANNPHPHAVNGSLWTLAYEGICYLCLGLASFTGLLRRRWLTLSVFLMVYATRVFDAFMDTTLREIAPLTLQVIPILSDPTGLPLYLAFLSGMVCYQYRSALRWNALSLIAAMALGWAITARGHFDLAWPPTLAFVVIHLARSLPFQRWQALGDYSYGMYIYAFPIQQCLASMGVQRHGWLAFTAASLLLSGCAGLVSWFALEKPAINLGRRLARRLRRSEARS